MRTAMATWLASMATIFVLLALFFLEWRLLVLTLPPLVYLALAGARPLLAPTLDIVRKVSPERSPIGQEITVMLRVANRGRRTDFLELFDAVPRELAVPKGRPHLALALKPGEEATLSYTVVPQVKGEFTIGPLVARNMSPSGLEYEEAVDPSVSTITVPPPLEDLRRAKIQPRRTRRWIGQIPSRTIGLGTEFWGLRDYVPGDEIRRINWKATARIDRLVSNEYEGERTGDVVIVLDAREEAVVGPLAASTTEHGVRAALAIAAKVLDARNRVGLIVQRNVLDWVYPAFGRKQLIRILDALVRVRPGGEWSFRHVAWALARFFPPNSQVILISPLLDADSISAVTEIAARGSAVMIISPSPIEIERAMYADEPTLQIAYRLLRMERENAVSTLRRFADVADWDPREPLAVALRSVTPWPRH